MFQNFTPYRYSGVALAPSLGLPAFTPCLPSQEVSLGFVPHETQLIVRIERKTVPAQMLKRRVNELADHIEQVTGRKPGKKARTELAEQARQELLPRAFPKRTDVHLTFLAEQGLLLVGSTSAADTDAIVTLVCDTQAELILQLLITTKSPAAVMSSWLQDQDCVAHGFGVGTSCVLQASDSVGGKVRYDKHNLDCENVREHLTSGKTATSLALSYSERVEFTLTEGLQFKSVALGDLAFEGHSADAHPDAQAAELFLWRAELGPMLSAVIEALGGVAS